MVRIPTPEDELRDPAKAERDRKEKALQALAEYADIIKPGEAEEPILHPATRRSLADWLSELNYAKELKAVKCKPRSKAMLSGPPGCGKTTFAAHLAARLGLPLISIRSESLQSKWVNESQENVGRLFDMLKALDKKGVVFFDEIDAIGASRESRSNSERSDAKTLNVILRKMEQVDCIMMAATNRPDILDPALWRRFDMQLTVELPEWDERFAILKRYAEPFQPSEDDLKLLTDLTVGASPALLRQLMEGVKRAVVIGDKTRRDISSAQRVYSMVIATITPPAAFKTVPPLWNDLDTHERLCALTWPMVRAT